MNNIKLFQEKKIRSVWNEEEQQWYFSVVDVVGVLTDSVNPTDYLKKMRKNEPDSAVVQFPYQNDGGVYHYPTALMEEMEQYMTEKLAAYLPAERIFRWKE